MRRSDNVREIPQYKIHVVVIFCRSVLFVASQEKLFLIMYVMKGCLDICTLKTQCFFIISRIFFRTRLS